MEKMIGVCGIVCDNCPAFIATRKDDDGERQKVAAMWSTDSKILTVDDINCYGCLPDVGQKLEFCGVCQVRSCGKKKGVTSCAHCDGYPCEGLERTLEKVEAPEAWETLETISHGDFPPADL